jgi:hypothetical protein
MSPRLDVPNIDLLEFGLNNLKAQSISTTLVCAVDKDLPEEKMQIVRKYADRIEYFGKYSYFARGGIWKKIWECWEKAPEKYLTQNGYDDYSSLNRFEEQVKTLDATNSHACLCSCIVDDKLINGKEYFVHNGNIDFKMTVGNHTYMGAYLVKKDYILNSGIGQYKNMWSSYFEGLYNLYLLNGGKPCSTDKGIFYYRNQPAMISKMDSRDADWCQMAKNECGYQDAEVLEDFRNTSYFSLYDELCKRENLGEGEGKIAWWGNR